MLSYLFYCYLRQLFQVVVHPSAEGILFLRCERCSHVIYFPKSGKKIRRSCSHDEKQAGNKTNEQKIHEATTEMLRQPPSSSWSSYYHLEPVNNTPAAVTPPGQQGVVNTSQGETE